MNDRSHLLTELRLPESMNLDAMSVEEAVAMMHQQDLRAVQAVSAVQDSVAAAIKIVVAQFRAGGRLFYFGAGTSGRLGVLDASECPPTFRTDPEMVQGIIAGGESAMFKAKEGAEDSAEQGAQMVDEKHIGKNDVVMGIAAGGTTPFVHGACVALPSAARGRFFFRAFSPCPTSPRSTSSSARSPGRRW